MDFLRATAIIYIIGIHHLKGYNSFKLKWPDLVIDCDRLITLVFLGFLVYLSGYFLSKANPVLKTWQDIGLFYKKRFLRIYPLYIFALLLFFACSFLGFKSLFIHTFLLNIVTGKSVFTLWFISVICFFYLLFPALNYKYNIYRIILFTFLIFLSLTFLNIQFSIIERRIVLYLPIFVYGIITARSQTFYNLTQNNKMLLFSLITSCCFAYMFTISQTKLARYSFQILLMFSSISPLLVFGGKIAEKIKYKNIIINLSYASFCMYLIQDVVLNLLLKAYTPIGDILIACYIVFVGVPVIYFASIIIQSVYDSILIKIRTIPKREIVVQHF